MEQELRFGLDLGQMGNSPAFICILVFDATRKNTYKNLANWYAEMRNHRPSIPCICAVNKIDGMRLINSFYDLMLKPLNSFGVCW